MWSLSIQYLQKCLLIFLIIAKNVYSFPSIMSEKYNLDIFPNPEASYISEDDLYFSYDYPQYEPL